MDGGRLFLASKAVERWIGVGTGKVAVVVSRKPWRTVALSVFVCALLSLGWLRFYDEQRVEKLYTPQHTRAFRDRRWVEDNFDDQDSEVTVMLNRENDDTNLLSWGALEEAFDIYDRVRRIRDGDDASMVTNCAEVYWTDVAYPARQAPHQTCQKSGVLAYWHWDRDAFLKDMNNDNTSIVDIINQPEKNPPPDCCNPNTRHVRIADVAAKLSYDDEGRVVGAGALKFSFYLATDLRQKYRFDPDIIALEKRFDKTLRRARFRYFQNAKPLTTFGLDKNYDWSSEYDRTFILFAIVIIVAYAYLALWNSRLGEKSRASLGLGAVLCVAVSTAAGFGLGLATGLTFSPSTSVCVFLILGIGLDDSFVIAGAVDEPFDADQEWYDPSRSALANDARRVIEAVESVEEVSARRVVNTLRSSGPSIAVTSVTDFVAFLAGSITRIPDIAAFCRFCAISVMIDFAMQLTFFVALLTLDQRRRLRKKVTTMMKQKNGDEAAEIEDDVAKQKTTPDIHDGDAKKDVELVAKVKPPACDDSKNADVEDVDLRELEEELKKDDHPVVYDDKDHAFWRVHYPKYLLSVPGKLFVLSVSAVVLALAVVGCVRFDVDMENDWAQVDAGPYKYAVRAWQFNEDHFSDAESFWVGLYTKHPDYFAGKEDMERLIDGYGDLGFVYKQSLEGNWYDQHQRWLSETNTAVRNSEEWTDSLRTFLSTTSGEGFRDKISFENNVVVGAEIDTRFKVVDTTILTHARRMRSARREVRKLAGSLGTVIVYADTFVWLESFLVIARETAYSMFIAVSTVLVVLLLLLGDVAAAFLVALCVADVCICVFGCLYWYNDAINFITAFFIVIAVGLSADAPAHLCRAFLDSRAETRDLRAKEALGKLGPSVFRGGVSTILGIAITGFTVSYIFFAFFRLLMTILILALWNGLAVMPVVCSLIGPMPTYAPVYA
eukprot:CAMPEP_0118919788 /NCGR_PEP_ID=MMETSP1166-20130328/18739_1 /TAXON_ID=1104430 /ORGANISM="Chrysoreinhardia sp, Strain CCMP3193" /LENGTH=946 /DNA_ID=CAMNT_0006860323 /DNA_START=21 /DNA_END=2861 /DNA_ORIENTATION=-